MSPTGLIVSPMFCSVGYKSTYSLVGTYPCAQAGEMGGQDSFNMGLDTFNT